MRRGGQRETEVVALWLVRHGETAWNRSGRFQGWTDLSLSAQGREHARSVAAELNDLEFDGVWSSDLIRATETARAFTTSVMTDRRLRELDFGELEGRTWEDLDENTRQALIGFDGFVAPGGESLTEMEARVFAFVEALTPGRHLVVTHAGPIRVLLRACHSEFHPALGQITVLDWTNKETSTYAQSTSLR